MSRFATIRWIRGLIPAFIMLLIVACLVAIVIVSTWGLPAPITHMVEKELSVQGNVVSIDRLKISIWAGFVLEADDVSVVNEKLDKDAALKVGKLQVDLDWSSLMHGEVVINRVELESVSLNAVLEGPAGGKPRTLALDQFDIEATIGKNDSVNINRISGFLQGMNVLASGDLPMSLFSSSADSPDLNLNVDAIRSSLYDAVGYVNEFSWKKEHSPLWVVNFSGGGAKGHVVRVDLDVKAQEFSCRELKLRDFMLNATYSGNMVQIKKFSCRGDSMPGMVDAEAALDFSSREIHVDFRSSAPLLHWARDFTGERLFLPYNIQLMSSPAVGISAKLVMNESFSGLEKINVMGSASVGAFKIDKEAFRKFSADFHYDDGNFYVSDLKLVHQDDALTGQIMGVGKKIQLDVRSSLSADVVVHLVRSFGDNTFKIPQELELRGSPDLAVKGEVNFEKGWEHLPKIERADIGLKLDDFTVRGVEMGAFDLRALVEGRNLTIDRCILKHGDDEFNLKGGIDGRDIFFALKTSFPIQLVDRLLPGMVDFPKKLVLPSSLALDVEGKAVLKEEGGIDLQSLAGTLNAAGMGWNGVSFKEVSGEGSYEQGKIDIRNVKLDEGKGFFQISAKGDLNGDLHLAGRNTMGLNEWDRLLGVEDIDFFVKRFKLSDRSVFDLSFEADLSLKDLQNKYEARATLHAENVEYLGVSIRGGDATAKIVPGKVQLSNVTLVYDNSGFLSSRKIRNGVSSSTLKASGIDFDFKYQTVAVHGLAGAVYPDYVMRMFSDAAADVLGDFLFTRPVTLSGGGVFPLEDDFSRMKGTISFVASSGQTEYPLLGTILKMTNASGSISISPEWVMIERLKGKIWGGSFEGKIGARIDKGSDINGLMVLQHLDLSKIGASYDKKMNPAIVHGSISFKSRNGSLNSIVAQGSAQLYDGNLVEIPLFGLLGKAISAFIPGVGHLVNYNITSASCDYVIEDGYIKSNSFDAKGTNMSLAGGGWIRLADQQVNADFKLGLRGLPGLFTSPIFLLAGGLFKVSGIGPLDNINWTLSPFSSVQTNPEQKQQKQQKKAEGKKGQSSSSWKFWK